MATNEAAPAQSSNNGAIQGAMVAILGIGLLIQAATLGLIIWLVASGGVGGSGKNAPIANASQGAVLATNSEPTQRTKEQDTAQNAPNGWSQSAKPGPITLLTKLPNVIPESDRDYAWYSSGDELFALQSTMTANFGALGGVATFRVFGRGAVEAQEGETLFPGSSVTVLKVTPNTVVIGNEFGQRDLSIPRPFGSNVRADPSAPPSLVDIAPVSESSAALPEASLIRPMDPRLAAMAEAMANNAGLKTEPRTAAGSTASSLVRPSELLEANPKGTKVIAESYPAKDWANFIRELQDSLTRSVLLLDAFDSKFHPAGIEVANILDADDFLFDFLKLNVGDIIVGVEGTAVSTKAAFLERIKQGPFEKEIRIQVDRDDEIIELVVKKFPQ